MEHNSDHDIRHVVDFAHRHRHVYGSEVHPTRELRSGDIVCFHLFNLWLELAQSWHNK
jgi:hypothetical protein